MSEIVDTSSKASKKSTKTTKPKSDLRQFIDDNMSRDYNAITNVPQEEGIDDGKEDVDEKAAEEPKVNNNTIVVTKEFTENIVKYVTYDDIIKQKDDEIKELKKKRAPHEKYITDYLVKLNEEGIGITNGALKITKSQSKAPVSGDSIKDVISKKIKDQKMVEEILADIESTRKTSTKTNLKRSYAKDKSAKSSKANKK